MQQGSAPNQKPGSGPTAGTVLVTVYGIGPYNAGTATAGLSSSGSGAAWLDSVERIDFDWCSVVEGGPNQTGTLAQLSRALIETAQVYGDERLHPLGSGIRFIGIVLELWFKALWISPALCVVILAPFVAVYTRMAAVPSVVTELPGRAMDLWTTMLAATAVIVLALTILSAILAILPGRRAAGPLLRRVVLLTIHPVLSLLLRFGSEDAVDAVRAAAKYVAAYGLVVLLVHSCSADSGRQWAGLTPLNMIYAVGALATAFVVLALLARGLAAPLKLARDGFNYVGDVGQRPRIQAALDARLAAVGDGSRVIVAGHSLGSVIALDSLCHSPQWQRFSRVTLVTGGSPIRRLFQRFLPGLFFPAEMPRVFDHLSARLPLDAWVNVYRAGLLRGDPVGQALFDGTASGIDVPLHQRHRVLFAAHTGYWQDDEGQVLEGVRSALAGIQTSERPAGRIPALPPEAPGADPPGPLAASVVHASAIPRHAPRGLRPASRPLHGRRCARQHRRMLRRGVRAPDGRCGLPGTGRLGGYLDACRCSSPHRHLGLRTGPRFPGGLLRLHVHGRGRRAPGGRVRGGAQ